MLIGLLADTHDRLSRVETAVDILNEKCVERVLHAGDYIAPFALKPLQRLNAPWEGVFGNNDGEEEGLKKVSGGRIDGLRKDLLIDGRRIVLVHERERALESPRGEVVVCGHTHVFCVEKHGGVVIVNPGECCGYLNGTATIALLETSALSIERVELPVG